MISRKQKLDRDWKAFLAECRRATRPSNEKRNARRRLAYFVKRCAPAGYEE